MIALLYMIACYKSHCPPHNALCFLGFPNCGSVVDVLRKVAAVHVKLWEQTNQLLFSLRLRRNIPTVPP